jgi:hypothetical protein
MLGERRREALPAARLEGLSWYEHPLVYLPIDVASTIFVGGLIGVLEVTLAHALIADAKRRRRSGALQDPASPSDKRSRRMEPVAETRAPAAHVTVSREGL